MKKLISGAISVEVYLSKTVNKVFFPDVADIRGKRIKHISFFGAEYSADPAFVTLKELNTQTELIKDIPLSLLHFGDNPLFINKIVDLPHSYIDISQIPTAQRNGKYLFVFWFDNPQNWGKVQLKRNRAQIHPIEIKLTGARTYFAENRDLYNKLFQNIIFSKPDLTPKGNQTTGYDNCFITLCKDNNEFIQRVPLKYFYQREYDSQLRLQNITFDFQKSYIETTEPNNYGKSLFFNAVIDDNK